jgi:hypothetical protein
MSGDVIGNVLVRVAEDCSGGVWNRGWPGSLEESAVEMEGTFEIEDALRNGGRSRNTLLIGHICSQCRS